MLRKLRVRHGSAQWTPRHFVRLDRSAKAFEIAGRQLDTCRGQFRIVAKKMFVGGFSDEDAAAARGAFEAACEVHLAAKDSVIFCFGDGAHETGGGHAGVDAAAEEEQR